MIRVADRGIGIPPELIDTVFDLFAQVERTMDRSEGGLGIGLSLVRNLVQMHGGTRRRARAPGAAAAASSACSLPCLASESARAPTRTRSVDQRSDRSRGLRVLVVDDNRDAADSLALLLNLRGYQTFVTHDGDAALEAAERDASPRRPARPRPAGAGRLRGLPAAARAGPREGVIVAITGYGQDEDRRRSRAAGFDAHLVKPVNPDELVKLVERAARARTGEPG